MEPNWKQTFIALSIVAGGLVTCPRTTLVVATLLVIMIVQMFRGVRKYGRTWPDVAGEQMREVEHQQENEKTRC